MLNRATNILTAGSNRNRNADGSWQVDRNPVVRLVWLFVLMLLPLAAVLARLAYLQAYLKVEIVTLPEKSILTYKTIPSRDGRILSSNGTILAQDLEVYRVLMHYRWLEEPADELWLRRHALSRLSRLESRNRSKIDAAFTTVEADRTAMWNRLAKITGMTPEKLAQQRQKIQKRIEHMIDSVERRQHRRLSELQNVQNSQSAGDDRNRLQRAWNTVVKTLTTPPTRTRFEPIVLPEETDYHTLVENVSYEAAAEIETHPELYPGLWIEASTQRAYPEKSFAAHLIGTRLPIGDEQLIRRSELFSYGDPLDYHTSDRIGKSGLERSFDRHLRGVPGLKRVVKNRRGEILRTETVRHPRVGRDIVLTLHPHLQKQTEELLDQIVGSESTVGVDDSTGQASAGGCIVVLNVHNGAVLAAASAPRFDLNLMTHPDPVEWKRVSEDPRRPFFHRATQMTIAPGSVFKTLTAIAVLESGIIDPDEPFFCRGFLDTPNRHRCYIYRHYGIGHGETDLSDAICRSCNVYFYNAARRMGPEPIVEWGRKFGFGQPTGIDLPGERGGNLPIPPSLRPIRLVSTDDQQQSDRGDPWYSGDTLGLAIGQSRLTVTPLQIVRMMAAIANGGVLVTPHIVDNSVPTVISSDDLNSKPNREPVRIPGLSAETVERVGEGLRRVVQHPRGTGYKRVRLEEITMAGKTGTAEVGGGKQDHAWFAGYVPAENPRYAFVVVLEHAGTGGQNAGPVARQLVQLMLNLDLLQPMADSSSH